MSSSYNNVFVYGLTGKTMTFNHVPKNTTVGKFKEMIRDKTELPVDEQRLIYAGKQLQVDHLTLEDYHVTEDATITLVIRLLGGASVLTRSGAKGMAARLRSAAPVSSPAPEKRSLAQDDVSSPAAPPIKKSKKSFQSKKLKRKARAAARKEEEEKKAPPPPAAAAPAAAKDVKEGEGESTKKEEETTSKFLTLEIATRAGVQMAGANDLCMIKREANAKEPRARMPCGHTITPEGLAALANSVTGLAAGGEAKREWQICCPEVIGDKEHCGRVWDWSMVLIVAMLETKERGPLEVKMSVNKAVEDLHAKACPSCQCLILPPVPSPGGAAPPRIRCPGCRIAFKAERSFCWSCNQNWKNATDEWCGNQACISTKAHLLLVLRQSPTLTIADGAITFPAIRACPYCLRSLNLIRLVEHKGGGCKHLMHSGPGGCQRSFCVSCLATAPLPGSPWRCGGPFSRCPTGVTSVQVASDLGSASI